MPDSEETRTTTEWRRASKFYRRSPGPGWLLALLLVPLLLGAIGYSTRDTSGDDTALTSPSVPAAPSVSVPNAGAPSLSFAPLSISRSGNDFTLSGELPDEAAKASLLDSLRGAAGADANLIDNVSIKAGVGAPDFSGIGAVFRAGATIPDFNLKLAGDTITLTGTAASEEVKSAVEAAAKTAWPNLKIVNAIRVTAPSQTTVSPAPAPAPTGGCDNLQADINALLRMPINFDTDGFTLTPSSRGLLTQVADKLKACTGSRVAVNGYTDNTGNDAINVPLSGNRAKAVGDFLVSTGISGDVVTSQGLGAANPVASNATPEGRAQNRRVEITVS